jgi:hypothetical protein
LFQHADRFAVSFPSAVSSAGVCGFGHAQW